MFKKTLIPFLLLAVVLAVATGIMVIKIRNHQLINEVGTSLSSASQALDFNYGNYNDGFVDIALSSSFIYQSDDEKNHYIGELDAFFIKTYCAFLQASDDTFALHIFVRDLSQGDDCSVFLIDRILNPNICL